MARTRAVASLDRATLRIQHRVDLPTTKAALPDGARKIEIEIPTMQIGYFDIRVVGDTPLIVHRFEEKARKQIADKQQGKAQRKKDPKVPADLYEAAFYKLPDGRYGLPVAAFRRAMIDAAPFVESVKKTTTRGSFTILADDPISDLVALTDYSKPHMREDVVRISMNQTDLRYRPQFDEWAVDLRFALVENTGLTANMLVGLLNQAGFSIGVCEWRPQKNGSNGRFHVEGVR